MFNFWITVWTILVAVTCMYMYNFRRKVKLFRKMGIPFIQPLPILGNMAGIVFRTKSLCDVIKEIYYLSPEAKYVVVFDFRSPAILIRDPELIKTIAVTNSESFVDRNGFVDEKYEPVTAKGLFSLKGQRWHDARALLSPSYTSSKMRSMFGLMSECATDFAEYISESCGDDEVNMKQIFTRYTNDVIASCAFGIKVDSMRQPENEFYSLGQKATNFDGIVSFKFFLTRNFPRMSHWLKIKLAEDHVLEFFKNVITANIATRKEKKIFRPDMLQLMMESTDKGNTLSIDDITGHAFVFFFAAFDTSSTTMCFIAQVLAQNPDVYKKLQDDVDAVWKDTKGKPTYEDINGMGYLAAVVNEVLRLYPPAVLVERECNKTFELPPTLPGSQPYVVQPGTSVWMPIFPVHRDAKNFTDPEKFDPDRFFKKIVTTSEASYMPFGVGPRMCIAKRFALLEIKVVLFHLLARCTLKTSSNFSDPLKFSKNSFVLFPEGGFWMNIQNRKIDR